MYQNYLYLLIIAFFKLLLIKKKAPDGKIIIYGGSKKLNNNIKYARVVPDLFVLNTVTEQFEFTVPPVESNIEQVPPLVVHTADLVENYMIVAFGKLNLHCVIKKKKSKFLIYYNIFLIFLL